MIATFIQTLLPPCTVFDPSSPILPPKQCVHPKTSLNYYCLKLWSDETIKATLQTPRDSPGNDKHLASVLEIYTSRINKNLYIRIRHRYIPATNRQRTVQ